MHVLVLGTGAVGSTITSFLDRDREISEITCGARNTKRAKDFIGKKEKVSLKKVNASDTNQVARLAKDAYAILILI